MIVGFGFSQTTFVDEHNHIIYDTTEEKAKQRWRGRVKAFGWIVGGTTVGLCTLVMPFILPALRKHCLATLRSRHRTSSPPSSRKR